MDLYLDMVMKQKWRRVNGIVESMWRWFISLRLTFVLLVLIALGAVLGMSFDQTKTFLEHWQANGDGLIGGLVSFFELYDAFHSWWFSLAILLLALNLIACSIERLPRIYFDYIKPRPYLTKRRRLGLNLVASRAVSTYDEALMLVGTFLNAPPQKAMLKNDFFYREKQGYARFGVYVVHIALLIIMFSAIYATQYGVDGHILIEEGRKERFVDARGPSGVIYNFDLGFYVGCDDFRLRTFIDNSPMEYESDLYIENEQGRIISKTVRVNEPLSFAGFTFYQSTFQPKISDHSVVLEVSDPKKNIVRLKLNEPLTLASGDILAVEKLYDDFAGLGQAVRISKKSENNPATYFHIFRRHPDYDAVVRHDYFHVKLLDVDQHYASGLSVGYVPGIAVIFSGFLLFLCGLILCFFMTPTRYFACIEPERDGYLVWFAAQGYRHHHHVKEYFYKRLMDMGKT